MAVEAGIYQLVCRRMHSYNFFFTHKFDKPFVLLLNHFYINQTLISFELSVFFFVNYKKSEP